MNHKTTSTAILSFLMCLVGASQEVSAGENKWTVLKQSTFKSPFRVFVVNPFNPDILYASVGDTGILKSEDNGKTWSLKNNGLSNYRIHKIVVDPFRADVLYSCTQGGLYRSNNDGEQWEDIGFSPDSAVTAIITSPHNRNTIYAAVDSNIYKSLNDGITWNLIPDKPDTVHSTIRSIAVSLADTNKLFVGTDHGIFSFLDKRDSLKVIRGPDEWKQKTLDCIVAPYRFDHYVFALLAGGKDTVGVYWAKEKGQPRWRKMNEGFSVHDFPLLSLSLNPSEFQKLFVTSENTKILSYEFATAEVGVLDFRVTGLPEWETNRVSRHIVKRLNENHFVDLISQGDVKRIIGNESDPNDTTSLNTVGQFMDVKLIVSGEVLVTKDSLFFNASVTEFTSGVSEIVKPVHCFNQAYYPAAIDKLVDHIHEAIDGFIPHPPLKTEKPKSKNRICTWIGPVAGLALGYGLHSIIKNDEEVSRKKLPRPPQFP